MHAAFSGTLMESRPPSTGPHRTGMAAHKVQELTDRKLPEGGGEVGWSPSFRLLASFLQMISAHRNEVHEVGTDYWTSWWYCQVAPV